MAHPAWISVIFIAGKFRPHAWKYQARHGADFLGIAPQWVDCIKALSQGLSVANAWKRTVTWRKNLTSPIEV